MRPARFLILLLCLAALPSVAADHSTCGPADGTVVDGLALWLRPGCLGAVVYVPDSTCEGVLFHGQILFVQGYSDLCGTGVWIP